MTSICSPGSPSQWKATRSPRVSRWRSRQFTLALSVPSANQRKKGGFERSHASDGSVLQVRSSFACASQKASGSAAAWS